MKNSLLIEIFTSHSAPDEAVAIVAVAIADENNGDGESSRSKISEKCRMREELTQERCRSGVNRVSMDTQSTPEVVALMACDTIAGNGQ